MAVKIVEMDISDIIPYANNPRINDDAVGKVAESIKQFGFKQPIVLDKGNVVIAGHTRLKAAQMLRLDKIPCIKAEDLTEEQAKAYRLADNKVAEFARWDFDALADELAELENIDMSAYGFDDISAQLDDIDANELDDDTEKSGVTISISCSSASDYESIKERLQNLVDEINAKISVKMS